MPSGRKDISKDAPLFKKGSDYQKEMGKKGNEAFKQSNKMRAIIRRIGALRFPEDQRITARAILCRICGDKEPTMTERAAVNKFIGGMTGGYKALDSLENALDGKQLEKVLTNVATLEDLVLGSYLEGELDSMGQLEHEEEEDE